MIDPVQEIKAKLSIEDIVSTYVPLKKAGKYFKANCPFHQEKTPSFYVNPEKQLAYCFSCRKGGDLFQFIQEIESMDFSAALEFLAEKAHVDIKQNKSYGGTKLNKDKKAKIKDIYSGAKNFYVQNLFESSEGLKVLEYLHKRGVKDDMIKLFELGFSLDAKDSLYRHLLDVNANKTAHEKNELMDSDLFISKDAEFKNIADRFKLRLMFPIDDIHGDTVAFGARALKSGDNPKYLNSPDSKLYDKSSILYNLNRAKSFIKEKNRVVVVEGYMDAIASTQCGVPEVVASCGTALSKQQINLLKRYTKKIYFAFDSDSAGKEALKRAVELAQQEDMQIYVVQIKEKDASELAKDSPELWEKSVNEAQNYMDYYFEYYQSIYDLTNPQDRRNFTDELIAIIQMVQHPVEADHYIQTLSKKVNSSSELIYDYMNKLKVKKHVKSDKKSETYDQIPHEQKLIETFFGLLLAFPKVFFELWNSLNNIDDLKRQLEIFGLNKRLDKLNQSDFEDFRLNFANKLNNNLINLDASSVYKQIEDHYNNRAYFDDEFYEALESGQLLKQFAFKAEVGATDEKWVKDEFLKLILEFYLLNLSHG